MMIVFHETALLVNITRNLLGNTGTILLGVIVAFACLTTSIGLTSVTAKYFEDISNKKLKYSHLVTFICIFSAITSNLGVDKLISIAAPLLTVIYPVSILLVVMSTFNKIFIKTSVYKSAAYTTLVVSLLTVADSFGFSLGFVNQLPFANLGFNWIIPAIVGGIAGKLLIKDTKNNIEEIESISEIV